MLAIKKNKNNDKIIKFNISNYSIEFAKKLKKLKSQKFFKFLKTLKSKKLSKSENLPKIDTKKIELSFLAPNTKAVFYYLWLAFIKILIFWHFNLKCYI